MKETLGEYTLSAACELLARGKKQQQHDGNCMGQFKKSRGHDNSESYTFNAKQASFTVVSGRLMFGVTQRHVYFWCTECLYIAYL